jgi:hypothetical protein
VREGRGLNDRSQATHRAQLERQADELLRAAADEGARARHATRRASGWTIVSAPEREAALVAGGRDDVAIARYAAELRARHDPRGELAFLLERADARAVEAFVKARTRLLFGRADGHVPMRHVRLERWRFGFLDRARLRVDRMAARDLHDFLAAPATRLLRELDAEFVDTADDPTVKVRRGREELERVCDAIRVAPCRDALEVVRVRSLDPKGQPADVLARQVVMASRSLRPLPHLRACVLVFDSE